MYGSIGALRGKLHEIKDGKYLLGLSGGADSVALLMMLLPSVRENRIMLKAVHVNHGIRGEESDEDERFCRELCKKESIPLVSCRVDLSGRKDEDSARKARYAVFRKQYGEYSADAIILAHHADDQAETFLMRLLRGAGPEGLACMKADETVGSIRILRPMLSMRRDEIRCALQTDGILWRDDTSNRDAAYLRNRVRKELIPVLTGLSTTAVEKICYAASLIGEDHRVLDRQAETILNLVSDGQILDAEALAKEPPAIRRRSLRIWWRKQGPVLHEHALSAAHTEALNKLLDTSGGKINLPGGMHAVRAGKHLFLTADGTESPLPVIITGPETVYGSFLLTETASEGNPGDGKRTQEVPAGFTRGCVIRTRLPGDRIHPFGCSGTRKLQDYLTDRKIAEPFRDKIPLMCRDREVLWVCGVGAGDIPIWKPQSSSVRLTWQGSIPWNE